MGAECEVYHLERQKRYGTKKACGGMTQIGKRQKGTGDCIVSYGKGITWCK